MTIHSALSATVKHFMEELKLSNAEVAAKCGLSASTVRRITQGTIKYVAPTTALKLLNGIVPPRAFPQRVCRMFKSFQQLIKRANAVAAGFYV